jgi:hypothetical protein
VYRNLSKILKRKILLLISLDNKIRNLELQKMGCHNLEKSRRLNGQKNVE